MLSRREIAAVGAYRKATTELVSSMLSVQESEDLLWAKELLPTSSSGAQAPLRPAAGSLPAPLDANWDRPFAAPCDPLRSRPDRHPPGAHHRLAERASEGACQQDPRRSACPFCRISTGSLPLAAQWLTRTRRGPTRGLSSSALVPMSRSDQPRQSAAQLDSLACLKDVVAHGMHSKLVLPMGLTVPDHAPLSWRPRSRFQSRSPVPKCGPRRRGSILLGERGSPTGLAVKCCLPAPPERSRLSRLRSSSPASAPLPQEPRTPPAPLVPPHYPRLASACRPVGSSESLRRATEGRRRSRDQRRRRTRRQAKRSVWRETWPQAHRRFTMWGCCDDTPSDDDEHNTSNLLLLLCAHALVAPALLSGPTVHGHTAGLSSRRLGVHLSDVELEQLGLDDSSRALQAVFSTGGRARALTCSACASLLWRAPCRRDPRESALPRRESSSRF